MSAIAAGLIAMLKGKLGMLLAGLAGGIGVSAVLKLAKGRIGGIVSKLIGGKIKDVLNVNDPADRALILALVKYAEAKLPDAGSGKERFSLVASKIGAFFPVLHAHEKSISEVIEEAVRAMDDELKKASQ